MGQTVKIEIDNGSFSVSKYLEDLMNVEPSDVETFDLAEFECEIPWFVRKQASL